MDHFQIQEVRSASPRVALAEHDKAPSAAPSPALRGMRLSIESRRAFANRGGLTVSSDGVNIAAIAETADGRHNARRILVFNPRDEQPVVLDYETPISSSFDPVLAFAPDGRTLYFSDFAVLNVLEIGTKARREVNLGRSARLCSLKFSSDGKTFVCAYRALLVLWNADLTNERALDRRDKDDVKATALSSDGRLFAAAGAKAVGSTLRFWDVASGKQIKMLKVAEQECSLSFSPDGTVLASTTGSTILLRTIGGKWEVTREWTSRLTEGESTSRVVFSPDGSMLASSGYSGVRLWDPQTGALLADLPMEKVTDIAWLDGGRRIVASVYQEGVVLLAVTGSD